MLRREARRWGSAASIPALAREMRRGSNVSAVMGCWHRALDFTRSLVWSSRENFRDQSTLRFVSVSAGDHFIKLVHWRLRCWSARTAWRLWFFTGHGCDQEMPLYLHWFICGQKSPLIFYCLCQVSTRRVVQCGRVVCVQLKKISTSCIYIYI